MSIAFIPPASSSDLQWQQQACHASPLLFRALLLAGCAGAVIAAAWLADPASYLQFDYELARLLRGMAVIKAALVLAAVGVLLWRFGHAISPFVLAALEEFFLLARCEQRQYGARLVVAVGLHRLPAGARASCCNVREAGPMIGLNVN